MSILYDYRFTLRLIDELRRILAQFIQQLFQFAHRVARVGNKRRYFGETTADKLLHVPIVVSQPIVHTRADVGQVLTGLVERLHRCQKIGLRPFERCLELGDHRSDLFENGMQLLWQSADDFVLGSQRLGQLVDTGQRTTQAVPIFLIEHLVCLIEQLADFMKSGVNDHEYDLDKAALVADLIACRKEREAQKEMIAYLVLA